MKLKTMKGMSGHSISKIEGIVVIFQGFSPPVNDEVEAMLIGHGHLHDGKPRVIFARVVDSRDMLITCTGFDTDPFGFSATSLDPAFPCTLTPGKTNICVSGKQVKHTVWIRKDPANAGRTRYRLEGLNNVEDFDWWQKLHSADFQSAD